MTINDPIFGEIQYVYGWEKDITIHFLGKENEIFLINSARTLVTSVVS